MILSSSPAVVWRSITILKPAGSVLIRVMAMNPATTARRMRRIFIKKVLIEPVKYKVLGKKLKVKSKRSVFGVMFNV
jgi:hypothetical protein